MPVWNEAGKHVSKLPSSRPNPNVLSPDRLDRRYVHQCVMLEELARWPVEVVFLNQPVSDRPEDRMMVQILGILAEYD